MSTAVAALLRPSDFNLRNLPAQSITCRQGPTATPSSLCRFVAHPRQMRDWKGDPPNLYDISGSAHFINKCDNGVVVHRNNDPNKGPQSEVGVYVTVMCTI